MKKQCKQFIKKILSIIISNQKARMKIFAILRKLGGGWNTILGILDWTEVYIKM
jgi:hypothetical protein